MAEKTQEEIDREKAEHIRQLLAEEGEEAVAERYGEEALDSEEYAEARRGLASRQRSGRAARGRMESEAELGEDGDEQDGVARYEVEPATLTRAEYDQIDERLRAEGHTDEELDAQTVAPRNAEGGYIDGDTQNPRMTTSRRQAAYMEAELQAARDAHDERIAEEGRRERAEREARRTEQEQSEQQEQEAREQQETQDRGEERHEAKTGDQQATGQASEESSSERQDAGSDSSQTAAGSTTEAARGDDQGKDDQDPDREARQARIDTALEERRRDREQTRERSQDQSREMSR